jgi:hypothetical protein
MKSKKLDLFLYINNEQSKKECRKIIPFTITSKKYLGINLKKRVKNLYKEKYKPLKEIKEDYRDGKISYARELVELT